MVGARAVSGEQACLLLFATFDTPADTEGDPPQDGAGAGARKSFNSGEGCCGPAVEIGG